MYKKKINSPEYLLLWVVNYCLNGQVGDVKHKISFKNNFPLVLGIEIPSVFWATSIWSTCMLYWVASILILSFYLELADLRQELGALKLGLSMSISPGHIALRFALKLGLYIQPETVILMCLSPLGKAQGEDFHTLNWRRWNRFSPIFELKNWYLLPWPRAIYSTSTVQAFYRVRCHSTL